ncbi:MAG TPA: hypothetical protein VGB08_02860 [Allosphingosinicella sp.]|jgi:hypothetical protein
MKKLIIAAALCVGGAAFAQTAQPTQTGQTGAQPAQQQEPTSTGTTGEDMPDVQQTNRADGAREVNPALGMAAQPGTGQGTGEGAGQGTGSGAWTGTGSPANGSQGMRNYPPCSRTVTDSCIQTNERGMRRPRR